METELGVLRAENARLRGLLGLDDRAGPPTSAWKPTLFTAEDRSAPVAVPVDRRSPPEAKVALFRSLFTGREDVHALRWDNERTGKAGWGPAVRGGWANTRRPDREYLPYTNEVIERHLAGAIHAGLYPLLRGDTSAAGVRLRRAGLGTRRPRLLRRRQGSRHPGRAGAVPVR